MPEITEETLVQRLCDPKQYEDALLEIKTTLDTVAGSSIVYEAFRILHATIAERDGQIAALVAGLMKMKSAWWEARHSSFVNQDAMGLALVATDNLLASLSEAAAAHDERLKRGVWEKFTQLIKAHEDHGEFAHVGRGRHGCIDELLEEAARLVGGGA